MSFLKSLPKKIEILDKDLDWAFKLTKSWLFYNVIGGYKCEICGANHLKFRSGETSTIANGMPMIMSWAASRFEDSTHSSVTICPLCFIDAIYQVFDNKNNDVENRKCDWYGETTDVVRLIDYKTDSGISITGRFGSNYWNGFYASRKALIEGVQNSTMKSSMQIWKNSKTYYNTGPYVVKEPQTFDQFLKSNKQFTY